MFDKMFSFDGTLSRKGYLIYGLLVPIFIFILMFVIIAGLGEQSEGGLIVLIAICLIFYINLATTVKRARETASNVKSVVIAWLIFTPLTIMYLLFAPAQTIHGEKKSSLIRIILNGFMIIVLLGILSAIIIPKLSLEKNDLVELKKE